ncbi:MAG: radical SAM protein [bacterium]
MISKNIKDYHASMPFYEIRLSVTGACNQNCVYCGPFVDGKHNRGYGIITLDQIRLLVDELKDIINEQKIHIQITGGEPTLRYDLVKIFALLNEKIRDIGMTTNGSKINLKLVKELTDYGLSDLHIHLPSLNKDVFQKTTRAAFDENRIQNVLDSALYIKKIGKRVEFNTPVTHINLPTLTELLDFCYKNKINLKLIEELKLDSSPHISSTAIKEILSDWIRENSKPTMETKIKNRYGIIYQFEDDFFFRIAHVDEEFKKNLTGASKKILLDGRYWVGGNDNQFLFTPSYSLPPTKGTIEDLKEQIKTISLLYKELLS